MSKAKNITGKVIARKAATQEEKSSLSTINLQALADKINASGGVGGSRGGLRASLYIYPELSNSGKKFAGNSDVINGLEGKSWRNARRKELQRFAKNSILYAVQKNSASLEALKKEFSNHYKTYYASNDWTIQSLTQKNNPDAIAEISAMLEIFKGM